ncbi:MAG: hypothetical protein QOJ61_4027, partial [Mycobacterium sp.]|nr:hypothetical protein [Mycobacterium sp.]
AISSGPESELSKTAQHYLFQRDA